MPRTGGPFRIKHEYADYLDSIRDELVQAEAVVDRIKSDPMFEKTLNYFNTLTNRGRLKYRPTKANGYRYEIAEEPIIINAALLQGIVSPCVCGSRP